MIGRTGRYRIRKTHLGKCLLQYESIVPRDVEEGGGNIRVWSDEKHDTAPGILTESKVGKPHG